MPTIAQHQNTLADLASSLTAQAARLNRQAGQAQSLITHLMNVAPGDAAPELDAYVASLVASDPAAAVAAAIDASLPIKAQPLDQPVGG